MSQEEGTGRARTTKSYPPLANGGTRTYHPDDPDPGELDRGSGQQQAVEVGEEEVEDSVALQAIIDAKLKELSLIEKEFASDDDEEEVDGCENVEEDEAVVAAAEAAVATKKGVDTAKAVTRKQMTKTKITPVEDRYGRSRGGNQHRRDVNISGGSLAPFHNDDDSDDDIFALPKLFCFRARPPEVTAVGSAGADDKPLAAERDAMSVDPAHSSQRGLITFEEFAGMDMKAVEGGEEWVNFENLLNEQDSMLIGQYQKELEEVQVTVGGLPQLLCDIDVFRQSAHKDVNLSEVEQQLKADGLIVESTIDALDEGGAEPPGQGQGQENEPQGALLTTVETATETVYRAESPREDGGYRAGAEHARAASSARNGKENSAESAATGEPPSAAKVNIFSWSSSLFGKTVQPLPTPSVRESGGETDANGRGGAEKKKCGGATLVSVVGAEAEAEAANAVATVNFAVASAFSGVPAEKEALATHLAELKRRNKVKEEIIEAVKKERTRVRDEKMQRKRAQWEREAQEMTEAEAAAKRQLADDVAAVKKHAAVLEERRKHAVAARQAEEEAWKAFEAEKAAQAKEREREQAEAEAMNRRLEEEEVLLQLELAKREAEARELASVLQEEEARQREAEEDRKRELVEAERQRKAEEKRKVEEEALRQKLLREEQLREERLRREEEEERRRQEEHVRRMRAKREEEERERARLAEEKRQQEEAIKRQREKEERDRREREEIARRQEEVARREQARRVQAAIVLQTHFRRTRALLLVQALRARLCAEREEAERQLRAEEQRQREVEEAERAEAEAARAWLETFCAVLIQKTWRGHFVRHHEYPLYPNLIRARVALWLKRRHRAALSIQRMWRGHRVRILLAKAREQSVFRGLDDFDYAVLDPASYTFSLDSLMPDFGELPPERSKAAAAAAGKDKNKKKKADTDTGNSEFNGTIVSCGGGGSGDKSVSLPGRPGSIDHDQSCDPALAGGGPGGLNLRSQTQQTQTLPLPLVGPVGFPRVAPSPAPASALMTIVPPSSSSFSASFSPASTAGSIDSLPYRSPHSSRGSNSSGGSSGLGGLVGTASHKTKDVAGVARPAWPSASAFPEDLIVGGHLTSGSGSPGASVAAGVQLPSISSKGGAGSGPGTGSCGAIPGAGKGGRSSSQKASVSYVGGGLPLPVYASPARGGSLERSKDADNEGKDEDEDEGNDDDDDGDVDGREGEDESMGEVHSAAYGDGGGGSSHKQSQGRPSSNGSGRPARKQERAALIEAWGIKDPKTLQALLMKNKRMKKMRKEKAKKEQIKDPLVRLQKAKKNAGLPPTSVLPPSASSSALRDVKEKDKEKEKDTDGQNSKDKARVGSYSNAHNYSYNSHSDAYGSSGSGSPHVNIPIPSPHIPPPQPFEMMRGSDTAAAADLGKFVPFRVAATKRVAASSTSASFSSALHESEDPSFSEGSFPTPGYYFSEEISRPLPRPPSPGSGRSSVDLSSPQNNNAYYSKESAPSNGSYSYGPSSASPLDAAYGVQRRPPLHPLVGRAGMRTLKG